MNPLRKAKSLGQFLYPAHPKYRSSRARLQRGLMNYARLSSWWRIPALQKAVLRGSFEFPLREGRRTLSLRVLGGDPSHLWAADEVFVERVYDLDKVPFVPDTIVDLGANNGYFTLLAAARWPGASFTCVEPHPTTFGFLCRNLEANNVTASKLQCAVSDKVAISYLQNESAIAQQLSDSGDTRTRTLTLPLDALLAVGADSRLLLKIDIEGSEVAALDHLSVRLPDQCFIFIELHGGEASVRWMENWARQNGFLYTQARRHGMATDGYLARA